jgi:hypothetical protein
MKMSIVDNPPVEENSKHEERDKDTNHVFLSGNITKAPKTISSMMYSIARTNGKVKVKLCFPGSSKLTYSVGCTHTNRTDTETTQTISPEAASTILRINTEDQVCKPTKERSGLASNTHTRTRTTSKNLYSSVCNPRTLGTAAQENKKVGDNNNSLVLTMKVDDVRSCGLSNKIAG